MKRSGQLIIGLLVAIAAVYYTMRNVSLRELLDSFTEVHYGYLLISTAMMILTYFARAVRWRVLLLPIKEVRTVELGSPLMVGFMAGVLPARAGELIRAFLLGKKMNMSFASALATIVVERLFDMVLLLLLFAWLLVFHADMLESNIAWSGIPIQTIAFQFGLFSIALVVGLVVFIYLLIYHNERALKLVHWVIRPFPDALQLKVVQMAETFSQGLAVVKSLRSLILIFMATALVWGLVIMQYYPLYYAYDLHEKTLASAILLTVMICIFITILPTPAFLGSLNAGVLIALHEIMNEPEVAAVSFGFVAWGLNFLVVMVGGVYFLLHDHISVKNLVEIEEEL